MFDNEKESFSMFGTDMNRIENYRKHTDWKKSIKGVEKEVKKKNTTSVKLPSARRSIQRQRHMAQGKKGYEDLWKFLTGVGVVLLIAFILLGGINQRKFIKAAKSA